MNTNELRCVLTRDVKIKDRLVDVFVLDQFKMFVEKNTFIDGVYVTIKLLKKLEMIGFLFLIKTM